MNIVKIFKSIVLGCLSALAAIVVEFLFMFNDDGIIEIDPGPVTLFVLQAIFFSVIVLLLNLQRDIVKAETGNKSNISFFVQIGFVLIYFVFIIVSPLLLYLLALISLVLFIVNAIIWLLKKDKKYVMQIGVYIMIVCLSLLLSTTTYLVSY